MKLEALSQLHDLVWIITKHTAVPQPRRSSNKSRSKIFENFSFSPSLYLVQVAKISAEYRNMIVSSMSFVLGRSWLVKLLNSHLIK